jgi:hypothetical protein
MIRCGSCGKLSSRRERTFLRVVETRVKHYDNGVGTETVQEIRVCKDCHDADDETRRKAHAR